jgi:antitoxin CcdA
MEKIMSTIHFDTSAPKKATNLSINSDLLRQTKELNINLSQTVEDYLSELVREAKRKQWLAENAEAIAAYNERIERDGVFSDGLRRF